MKIQQIRNATLKISYADKIFLIDPYLEGKNKFGCFADIPNKPFLTADNVKNQIPAPICELPFSDVKILSETVQIDKIKLTKTPALHGKIEPMCNACGVIFQAENEKTLYIADDTIWFDGVKNTLKKFSPEIVVLNACAAEFLKFGRLIMNDEDIDCVHQTLPDAKIFLTHLDNVPHAAITRQTMRGLMAKRGIENYFMPADGEVVKF